MERRFTAIVITVVVFLHMFKETQCYPSGPPTSVCSSLLPTGHSGTVQASDPPGGFYVFTELLDNGNNGGYDANTVYEVVIGSPSGTPFRGFVLQARQRGSSTLIGTFTIIDPENSQYLGCSENDRATVVHPNNNMKTRVSFEWNSPSTAGNVEFRYTIVTGRSENYYGDLNAEDNRPPPASFFPTALGDHSFTFATPEGCTPGTSCTYYVGLAQNMFNEDYLDVYLDGTANGWLAIGFSEDRTMGNDDVLGCRVNSDNTVTAVDTYNIVPNPSRANELDDAQDDIVMHLGTFNDGRISCSFSRLIDGDGSNKDFDLNNTFYYFYGRREGAQTTDFFSYHSSTPIISSGLSNPTAEAVVAPVINETCPPGPGDDFIYTFNFNNPGDSYHLAAAVNPADNSYMVFRLEADAQGWVGVGLSDNQIMQEDDVLGCLRDPNNDDSVAVIDAYNPTGQYNANSRDPTQQGVCTHSTAFTNGRITCTFSRQIQAIGDSDRNLNEDWFMFFGISGTGGSQFAAFSRHTGVPDISRRRANLVTDSSPSIYPRTQLLKAHGALMIITWPLMAVIAIFFAAWMRPALPNGEWFQVHRVFMVVALFVGAVGFIFAFVANAENATPGLISFACGENTTHFVFGIIVFLLQIINPIISIFRCSPQGERRWIFNLIHGSVIGLGVELLALVNVGIGIALFEAGGCSVLSAGDYTILWVYIGFVIFLLTLQVVLFIVFSVLAIAAGPEKRVGLAPSLLKYFLKTKKVEKPVEMVDPAKSDKPAAAPSDPPPRKPPSEDSPLRWIFFTGFLVVTLALMLAIVILIIIN